MRTTSRTRECVPESAHRQAISLHAADSNAECPASGVNGDDNICAVGIGRSGKSPKPSSSHKPYGFFDGFLPR